MKKEKPAKENKMAYTPTEVGTMLEQIEKSVKLVAEGHGDLNKKMDRLEVEVHGNSRRLDMVEMRVDAVSHKVGYLEDAMSKLGKDLKKEIADTKAELKADIRELGNRLISVESK